MRKHIEMLVFALAIAAVWGYFSDLRNGQTEWFIGRLALVGAASLAWSLWINRDKG